MKRAWGAWAELWDRREDAAALALVRIFIGAVVAYDLLEMWRVGAIEPLLARPGEGYASASDGWAVHLFGAGAAGARALWLTGLLAALAVAGGVATRAACIVSIAVSLQIAQVAPDGDRGIDQLMRVVLAILALSRCHARWSADAWLWRRAGRPIPTDVPAWPRYLLLLQLLWVYASGGMNKGGAEWGPTGGFTALANALTDPHIARFDPAWVEVVHPLTRVATAATMLFELSAPLYLALYHFAATRDRPGRLRAACNRLHLRWVWLALGAAFHLGIACTLRLGIFPFGMLALYPILMLPGELRRSSGR
ncbi:MAG: HTTM domain-containing protein [Deltaproteobacteria bacterium]|nr:HTTM domain-containing protein [Deltaproteobacteria bacterium]